MVIGFMVAATAAGVAAAGAVQPLSHPGGPADSASGLQGWGKSVELSSRSSDVQDVGVWAVDGSALGMLSARPQEVSVDTGGLALDRISVDLLGRCSDLFRFFRHQRVLRTDNR